MFDLQTAHFGTEVVVLCACVLVLLVLVVVGWIRLRGIQGRLAKLESSPIDLPTSGPSSLRRMEQELNFLVDFIRDFPQLLYEFESQSEVREVPAVLLRAVVRLFKAEQAVVAIRRQESLTDPGRGNRLIVAALASAERGLKVGSEIPLGQGQLGITAANQIVMDRQDFAREPSLASGSNRVMLEPELDAVAPMIVNSRTVGVVAFARPARHHPRAKEMLKLVAQLGALTWFNLSSFRTVKYAAEMDELTGIFNKAALKLRLSEHIHDARTLGGKVAVFLFDIDNFKNYNDLNGHLAGDHLLRLLAQLVREEIRSGDVFGRFGGEEFLLIMPGRSRGQGQRAAEKIRQRIAEYGFEHRERQPLGCVSVSGGVACFPDDADEAVELLRAADAALYRAKEEGRNRVGLAETGLNPGGMIDYED